MQDIEQGERPMHRSVRQLLMAVAAVAPALAGTAAAQDMTHERRHAPAADRRSDQHRSRQAAPARSRGRARHAGRARRSRRRGHLSQGQAAPRAQSSRASEYMDVRDRLENLRDARQRQRHLRRPLRHRHPDTRPERQLADPTTTASERRRHATPGTIPSGTELDVRLETALSSDTAQVEDRFEGDDRRRSCARTAAC